MEEKSTQSRERGQGENFPLRGQGAESLVGFGATPQLFHGRPFPRKPPTKGAGSEASLPVTLRIRRCAPKLLYLLLAYCCARWARPDCWSCGHSGSFLQAGDFASAEATRGLSDRPLDPFGLHPHMILELFCGKRENQQNGDGRGKASVGWGWRRENPQNARGSGGGSMMLFCAESGDEVGESRWIFAEIKEIMGFQYSKRQKI